MTHLVDLERRRFLLGSLRRKPTSAPGEGASARQVAVIGESCLTGQGVVCQSCGDACDDTAILFVPRLGHVPRPHIDAARCTACGACQEVCPAGAIALSAGQEVAHDGP